MTAIPLLDRLFRRSRFDDRAHLLWDAIVGAARRPALYAEMGVPDTLDGRFEMVILHAHLVMRRLRGEGEAGRERVQQLFDLMTADFDRTLREIGVGDLKVGRRIKQMVEAYYGRAKAYDAALAEPGEAALAEALERNAWGTVDAEAGAGAQRLAAEVRRREAALEAQESADLLEGRIHLDAG